MRHERADGPPLPPVALPRIRAGRVRKRWTYAAAFSPGLSLCAAQVRVGPLVQEFWAVWDGERLHGRTLRVPGRVRVSPTRVRVPGVMDLVVTPVGPVEVVTPYGGAVAWTRKQTGRLTGTVELDGRTLAVDAPALVDESGGHPPRRTCWLWSAGCGVAASGAAVAWNTTVGLHDVEPWTESTVWLDGVPRQVPVGRVAPDLSGVAWDDAALTFRADAVRRRTESLLVVRSSYEQPFGSFSGTLPGGVELAQAHGVMERHDAVW